MDAADSSSLWIFVQFFGFSFKWRKGQPLACFVGEGTDPESHSSSNIFREREHEVISIIASSSDVHRTMR
jgi:hypothetical protein